eukprot:jgi/Orpsp1_1/1183863/evm.model.c7180000086981.2
MDKIKLYNVNYSNNPTYYDDIEDDESCTSGVCIDKSTGFLGYKIKPANQKNTYFISYDYLLQRYVDLYINELLEKMNPRGQNKKLILIFTIPLFEDDSKKLSKNESFKYYNNLTRKRYIDNINKGLSKYKEDILGVVYMTEIEGLIYHWKNIYESKLLQKIKCDPNRRQNLEYQKKVLFIDFGCYYTRYYFVNIYSINNKNNKNNENDNDYEILEWDVLNIAGEMINEGIIQLLLKKYPEIKKGYSKILGKYKIWRTVDQEIKRAFTNSNLKDFSCEILSSGDYYDCMINRNEINTILHPYCEILINTIKNISSKYNINQSELEICISGDGALIFKDYITNSIIDSESILKDKISSISWNQINSLNGSLLKLQENINKIVMINRRRRISTLSEKRSISKILYNQHSFDSVISMESNLKNIFHPSQKIEFNLNPNQTEITSTKLKAISDSSISEYNTEEIIDFKNVDDVVHYFNTSI